VGAWRLSAAVMADELPMNNKAKDMAVGMPADPEKRRLFPNASFAVLQVVVTSLTLFLLYRYLLSTEGIEALGVWSLVVAATSLASVSNLGFAGGTVRFVSKYLAHKDKRSAAMAAETAAISLAVVMAVAVLVLWPIGVWLLGFIVPLKWLGLAHELLPYTLLALWLNSVGGAIHSGLDGCHRADQRSLVTMAVQPALLFLAYWLIPITGIKGLAYAQVLQYLIWSGLGWLLLRNQLPALSILPWRWSRTMFLEMWRYSIRFQAISILGILAEPLLKGLISHFGNLGAVGYFEMANRLVSQVRSLLVSANQVFVPYYSKLGETARDEIKALYIKNLNAIVVLGSFVFSSLVASLPLISQIWIGYLEQQFLLFSVILACGWFVNVLAVPAYFANLGGGWIERNLYCHIAQTMTTFLVGVVGGMVAGAAGSATAWPLALVVGAILVVYMFHRAEGIPLSIFVWPENIKVMILGSAIAVFSFTANLLVADVVSEIGVAVTTLFVLLIGGLLFFIAIPQTKALLNKLYHYIVLRQA